MGSRFFDYPGDEEPQADEGTEFLAGCSEDDWAAIRSHSEARRYRAGEVVVSPGDTDRALYVVVDGVLDVAVPSGPRGRLQATRTMGAGSVIGEMGFLDGQPRSALIRAATDVQLLRLGIDAFDVLAGKRPALARAVLFDLGRILSERLRALERAKPAALT